MSKSIKLIEKPKFVIFEGCDRVGKTSLFKAFRAATDYGPLAIDRFTGSNWVYDKYYCRPNNLNSYLEVESTIQDILDCYLVGLVCDPITILERISREEEGQDRTIALENYQGVLHLFEYYYMRVTRFNKLLLLDTGILSIEECLDMILEFTGERKN